MVDLEWLRRLIDLMDESEIDSLEVRRFTTTVKISKSPPVVAGGGAISASAALPPAGGTPGAGAEAGGPTAAEPEEEEEELYEVVSPMVGTFYRAPAPDAPPYVEVGDRITRGQTLCILEAMKLMNELEAEVAGVVREVVVQNADPVEYGQLLFKIEQD